jgi:hypothetical protein
MSTGPARTSKLRPAGRPAAAAGPGSVAVGAGGRRAHTHLARAAAGIGSASAASLLALSQPARRQAPAHGRHSLRRWPWQCRQQARRNPRARRRARRRAPPPPRPQMNLADSERMAGVLESAGYDCAEDPSHADVLVYNTCSIREKAEVKVYSALGKQVVGARQAGMGAGGAPAAGGAWGERGALAVSGCARGGCLLCFH